MILNNGFFEKKMRKNLFGSENVCTFAKKIKYMPKTPVTREPMAMRLDKAAIAYLRFHRIRPNSILNSLLCDYVRHCQRDDRFYSDVMKYGHRAHYRLLLDSVK